MPFFPNAMVTVLGMLVWSGSMEVGRQSRWRRTLDTSLQKESAGKVSLRYVVRCAQRCWVGDGCCQFFVDADDGSCSTVPEVVGSSVERLQYDYVSPTGCPTGRGYSLHYCRCILLVPTPATYTSAQGRCHQDGAHLLHYKSLVLDQPAASRLLQEKSFSFSGTNRLWVGAADEDGDGQYEWSDGEAVTASSGVWDTGEPSTSMSEYCVVLRPAYKLANHNCSKTHGYICQIDF